MKYVITIAIIIISFIAAIGTAPAKRIWNGNDSEIMPHVCMLFIVYDNPSLGYLAGGTIISNRHVLTAAHALQRARDINIGYGSNLRLNMQTTTTTMFMIHGEYDPITRANDIAIIFRTAGTFEFSETVKAALLPDVSDTIPTSGIVAGFGFHTPDGQIPEVLQYAEIETAPNTICTAVFPNADLSKHFCVSSPNQVPSHLCPGDNGIGFFIIETIIGEPETEEPVTEEPVTEEPVTEEPVTEEPVTEDPDPVDLDVLLGRVDEDIAILFGIASHIVQGCSFQHQPASFVSVKEHLDWIHIFVPTN